LSLGRLGHKGSPHTKGPLRSRPRVTPRQSPSREEFRKELPEAGVAALEWWADGRLGWFDRFRNGLGKVSRLRSDLRRAKAPRIPVIERELRAGGWRR
jgi:hypothetical protein